MANQYYNNQHTLNKHELAKNNDVENKLDGVEAGFDLLPTPNEFATILTPFVTATLIGSEYTAVLPNVTGYVEGMTLNAKVDGSNAGASTVNINNLGSISLVRPDLTSLEVNDVLHDSIFESRYNGTVFVLTIGLPNTVKESSDAATASAASAAAALVSETNSANSETNSANSETNSANSETNSAASALISAGYSDDSQLKVWEAEAEQLTADSYATQVEDTFVNVYTSDNDGTFTATPTTDYSALHSAAKAAAESGLGGDAPSDGSTYGRKDGLWSVIDLDLDPVINSFTFGSGIITDWDYSITTGPNEQPIEVLYSNGIRRFKILITWGTSGGADGNPTIISSQISENSGINYTVYKTLTIAYDVDGNNTTQTWS